MYSQLFEFEASDQDQQKEKMLNTSVPHNETVQENQLIRFGRDTRRNMMENKQQRSII